MSNTLPWPDAKSPYANAGPDQDMSFVVAGVTFSVYLTDKSGRDTGRRRYKVACVDCDCILHSETTGPSSHVEGHLKERHGFKGELQHAPKERKKNVRIN